LPITLSALDVDLVVSDIIIPSLAYPGQKVEIAWTITNQGTDDISGTWDDYVSLSSENGAFGQSGWYPFTGKIAANETIERRQLIQLHSTSDLKVSIKVDDWNRIVEFGKETNNEMVADHFIKIASSGLPTPNLQVSSITAPPTAFSSQEIEVSWAVTNQGSEGTNSSAWHDRVWLSLDRILDNNDTFLGNALNSSALAVGESYINRLTTRLPNGIAGNYYVLVRTDGFSDVFEAQNEADNLRSSNSTTQVDLTPPSDLQVSLVNAPARGFAGQPLNLSWTVANQGQGRTLENAWYDEVYLSVDEVWDANDRSMGRVYHNGALNSEESYRVNQALTVPSGLEDDFYVFVRTDRNNQVYEHTFESNNAGYDATPVRINLTPPADLVVSSVVPATGEAGTDLRVQWTVINQGFSNTEGSSWIDRVIASRDEVLGNSDDVVLGEFSHSGLLGVDEVYLRDEQIALPFNLEGAYQVFVMTDAKHQVDEVLWEDNNMSVAQPISIAPARKADLLVGAVSAESTVQSGNRLTVNWTVQNQGEGRTNSSSWYDVLYLSTDRILSGDDQRLGDLWHSGALQPGGNYTASRAFEVPIDLAGQFYVLVQTDSLGGVDEGTLEANNVGAMLGITTVNLSPVPDLVMQGVDAPATAISGRSLQMNWTVRNDGSDAARNWRDTFYLSRDQVFDRDTDIVLGSYNRGTGLAAGQSYTETQTFTVPQGLEGSFYVFAVADSGNSVYERRVEANNISLDRRPLQVSASSLADFVVADVTVPLTGVSGREVTIGYTVNNQGDNPARGSWTDTVYLSMDAQWNVNDVLIGRVQQSGEVASGGSYSGTLRASLPGAVPGNYHVLVRSDIRNQVAEAFDINNLGVSQTKIALDVEQLIIDTSITGTLAQNQPVYYRVDVAEGESLLLNLDSVSTDAFNELYVRYGALPTRSAFDIGFNEPFGSDQQVLVPTTQAGSYYILAYGNSVPGGATNYALLAQTIDFAVLDKTYGRGGTAGNRTIEINGNNFDRTVTAHLTNEIGVRHSAISIFYQDETKVFATFDLKGLTPGEYDVLVENNDRESAIVSDGLTVVQGGGAQIVSRIDSPAAVVRNRNFSFTANWGNQGINDALVPLFLVENTVPFWPASDDTLTGSAYTFLGVHSDDGPPGILRPGQSASKNFFSFSDNQPGSYRVTIDRVLENSEDLFDWNSIRSSLKPIDMSESEFEPIFAQLIAQVGSTNSGYLRMLSRNVTLLPTELEASSNIGVLLDLELRKAQSIIGTSLSGVVNAKDFDIDISGRTIIATNTNTLAKFSTITLNDGSFVFEDIPSGTYELEVKSAKLVSPLTTIKILPGQALTGVSIDINNGSGIRGRVKNSNTNLPVPETIIAIFQNDKLVDFSLSDRDGNFSITGLNPGGYTIEASPLSGSVSAEMNVALMSDDIEILNISISEESGKTIGITSSSSGSLTTVAFNDYLFAGIKQAMRQRLGQISEAVFDKVAGVVLDGITEITDSVIESAYNLYLNALELTVKPYIIDAAFIIGLRDDGGIQGGLESVRLYDQYFSSTRSNSMVTFSENSGLAKSLKSSDTTKSVISKIETKVLEAIKKEYAEISLPCDHPGFKKKFDIIADLNLKVDFPHLVASVGETATDKQDWDFNVVTGASGVLVGGNGKWGGPGSSVPKTPDARYVTGFANLEIKPGDSEATVTFDLKVRVEDGLDFSPGNTLNIGKIFSIPSLDGIEVLGALKLLEENGRTFDVPFNVEFKPITTSKNFSINLDEDNCEDLPDDADNILRPISLDPNDILSPVGFGQERWVSAGFPIPYTIRFENDPILLLLQLKLSVSLRN
jgi:hypothetical protein